MLHPATSLTPNSTNFPTKQTNDSEWSGPLKYQGRNLTLPYFGSQQIGADLISSLDTADLAGGNLRSDIRILDWVEY